MVAVISREKTKRKGKEEEDRPWKRKTGTHCALRKEVTVRTAHTQHRHLTHLRGEAQGRENLL